mmetsp:Transcript_43782/g.49671  ORF Transcript_43782/g.49671 Transcript_43782/m.49671 type:complete len:135 (-) Transcript_43782:237-641(-)
MLNNKTKNKRDRKVKRQEKQGNKNKPPVVTGYSIAARNTAESKWKSNIQKLQRQESQMKDYLIQMDDIRSKGTKNITKREAKVLAMEDEYLIQLEEATDQLGELTSLSKEEAIQYYATPGSASNIPKTTKKGRR